LTDTIRQTANKNEEPPGRRARIFGGAGRENEGGHLTPRQQVASDERKAWQRRALEPRQVPSVLGFFLPSASQKGKGLI